MTIICNYCESEIIKYNLAKHQKSETCSKIKLLLNKQKNQYELLLNEKEYLIKVLEDKNKELSSNILNLTVINNNMKNNIKILEKSSNEYRKIVEKAATKTTIKNNYNHNNYLNYISSEPIRFDKLKSQLKQIINCDTVMYDDNEFHDHIVDNIFKDKSGKDKVLCTDINRKNFTYKDETSGELISDPELERLREQLKKGTNIKQIRKDLLEKLVTEYEKNECIGIDPYKQFSEIIQKLNFGTLFVDHIAKKTYIKSKNYTNDNLDSSLVLDCTENINYDLEYDEEEYQKLIEEFGKEL